MTPRKPAQRPTRLHLAIRLACALPLAAALGMSAAHADDAAPATTQTYAPPTFNDWGGVGLWQTPTARMSPAGEFGFTLSHVSPYTRYNFLLQPFSWLQATFRYSDINNRPYGPAGFSGTQTYKDKSIDAKVRLWQESRYLPDVAVGIRDLAGTGLFSGEYVVASKRFGSVDASLGLGWGYLGARGDLPNPLDIFSSKFATRPNTQAGGSSGGQFNVTHYFRGRTALFGGISWQTPLQKLIVKLEYEGNNYQHEPFDDNQRQRTPLNLGVVYRFNDNVDFSAAIERGNTALFSLTLHSDLAAHQDTPKPLDPPPPRRVVAAPTTAPARVDWPRVSQELHSNAGLVVSKIAQRGSELVVTAQPDRYYYSAEALGRMARVLDQYLGPGIDWYSLDSTRYGMPVVETSVDRKHFEALLDHRLRLDEFSRSVEQDQPLPEQEQVLYRAPLNRYQGDFSLGYNQSVGGPNAFVLYQIDANYDASYFFAPGIWWSGQFSANLINNYDKFTYDAPSDLPRVRTYIREYLTSSRITMPLFQFTAARRIAPDWYAMAYGGMLEMMYGGVGGEVLYRPFGQRWAIGADINWVKQRGFDQDFSFRAYHVVTGQLTSYWDTGIDDITVKVSVGQYLAGDRGGTIDISRQFRNGVTMGAYATFTNVSAQQFGEGSFDKGIYFSIPFDILLPRSTQSTAKITWEPLLRDGGARLDRQYTLYDMTSDRDSDNFNDNLNMITH
jgi:Exopolysaccharide biosynthesis protein YbjH